MKNRDSENEPKDRVVQKFLKIVYKIIELEKRISNYGTDTKLYSSEINMIKTIKEYPDYHISELARQLNVTKGAVSQVIAKLYRKKMIEKKRDVNNKSRFLITLTEKGEIAHAEHMRLNALTIERIKNIMEDYFPSQVDNIYNFLNDLDIIIDNIE